MKSKQVHFLKTMSIFALLLMTFPLFSQKNITGKVADESEIGLPGVTVLVKSTTIGTVTDIDGKYTLAVPADADTLVFSFIGMVSVEKPIIGTTINCVMQEAFEQLEEVLIIGYGTMKKEDKTGAVAQVKAEELNGGVITDPMQAMQGKAAGVLISKKGGDPNEGFSVKIRGASGFNSNTQPLYVVDGIPGVDPTTIAPEDIETFNILKDAASAAMYGSQGSNGVVIITTKKGKYASKGDKKTSNISYNSKISFDRVANTYDLFTADDIRDHANTLLQAAQSEHTDWTIDSIFTDGGANTDWQDEIYRVGVTTSNNISFSGGTETGTYYASLTHANWDGVMKGTSKERTIGKINVSHKGLNDRLTINGSISGTFENNDYENYDGWDKDDIIYQAISRNPTDPVYNSSGGYYKATREFNYENPISVINEIKNEREAKRFFGSFKSDLEIFTGLVGSVSLGYTRDDEDYSYFRPNGLFATADNGFAQKKYANKAIKLLESTLNWKKSFNNKHNIDLVGGYSWQGVVYNGFRAQGRDVQSEYIEYNDLEILNDVTFGDIDSWKSSSTLIGFFGRLQYNFSSKYYVAGSIRRDGSSKFGENNKWGWFPTASAGWNLHYEEFMSGMSWLNQLKLRVSYGVSGNQEIGEYHSLMAYTVTGRGTNPETGQQVVTYGPAWNANPDLKWEETQEINFGIDYAILNSRISGSLEIYHKRTNDLLGEYSVPVPPNLASKTFANSGEMENKGIEFNMMAHAIDRDRFKWKVNLNVAHNKSKVLDLGDYFNELDGVRKEGYISGRGMVGEEYYVTGIIVGEEIGAFYVPTYVTILDGEFIYESLSGGYTKNLSEAKRTVVGNPNPDAEIGLSNTFTFYKRLTLDVSLRSWIGNEVYNATEMFFDNPTNVPSLNALKDEALEWYDEGRISSASIADIYVQDASFLRVDYVSLGYDINVSKIKWMQSMKIYIASNNLFTITGYKGIDPETKIDGLAYGIDQYNVYPKTRTLAFGVNVNF